MHPRKVGQILLGSRKTWRCRERWRRVSRSSPYVWYPVWMSSQGTPPRNRGNASNSYWQYAPQGPTRWKQCSLWRQIHLGHHKSQYPAVTQDSGPVFTKKAPSYWYRDPYYKTGTVTRPSYFTRVCYTGETAYVQLMEAHECSWHDFNRFLTNTERTHNVKSMWLNWIKTSPMSEVLLWRPFY